MYRSISPPPTRPLKRSALPSIVPARQRCTDCIADKQKCVQSHPQARCSRCENLDYQCSLVQNESDNNIKRRKLSRMKCEQCRHAKQKCLPNFRVWPDKCERCLSKGFSCSEPQKAPRTDDHQASASHAALPESISALIESEDSDSSDAQVLEIRPPRRGPWSLAPASRRPKPMSFSDVVRRAQTQAFVYSHQPLHGQDFRVLVLHPGSGNDTIFCHLIPYWLPKAFPNTSPMSEGCGYTALSYFWGWETDDATHEIRILGPPSRKSGKSLLAEIAWKIARNDLGKPFYVRPNLLNALRQLRRVERDVVLWVDALCINVNDIEERNDQTKRMPAIFSRAENVSVWLGNATEYSDLALSFIPKILDLQRLDTLVQDVNAKEEWLAFGKLMTNRWFSRRWVLQEVVLARSATLHCGQRAVRWSDFADAVALFIANLGRIKQTYARLRGSEPFSDRHTFEAHTFVEATSNLIRRSSNGELSSLRYSIEALVSNLFAFEVTNPKDAIYSLLALAKDASIITVDYSHSSRKVFTDFVLSSISLSGSLDIICRHWAPAANDLPSWILPVSGAPYGSSSDALKGRINGDSFVGRPGRKLYNSARGLDKAFVRLEAGAALSSESDVSANGGTLRVRGLRIDRISHIGARSIQGIIDRESLEMGGLEDGVWDDADDMELGGLDDKRRVPRIPEALWRTLVADRDDKGNDPPLWYRRAFSNCLEQRTTQGDIMTNEITRQNDTPRFVNKFLQRVQAVIWNRKFFLAKTKSLFGLAPSQARHGDFICILFGCSVPVVLRENQPRWVSGFSEIAKPEQTFTFIGECYVHGLMDGEAKEMKLGWEERDFFLE